MSTSTPPPPPVSHSEQQQPAGLQPPTQAVFTPVALVTAGSAGLGAAIVRRFAAAGLSVVINYAHNRDRAVGLATELHERYGSPGGGAVGDERKQDQGGKLEQEQEPEQKQRFVVIEADMAERASIEHLVRVTLAALGRLDVVVSNAGWTPFAPFDVLENALDEGDWDRCFGVNVKSCFWLMAAAREALEESSRRAEEEEKEEKEEQGKGYRGEVVGVRGGCFVSTASLSGVRPGGSSLVCVCLSLALFFARLVSLACDGRSYALRLRS
ncbi:MAG: hypothetical protein M1819_005443 [Sarea resinae]|nr:MAG: hypothetical protein M1819_005443 [Sarea resinae]